MENTFKKYERAFNKFMAWTFGIMTGISIIGIFWNPAQFVIAGICAIFCFAFIRELQINK